MPERHRFDHFELAVAERQLTIGGEPVVVGSRAFDVLLALVERRDRVVTKGELLELAWPGLVVEENNLQVQVSTLRKLLGARVIATVPGRGYRFTAPPRPDIAREATAERPAAPRTNLPQPRTRFIGREAALADCARLLAHSRLITLSGIGGCGKTRLAQEMARQHLGAFAGGVWFVALAPVQDGERVADAVAATLGVAEVGGTSLIDRLVEHVASRRLLIVLDNCEHVIDAVVAVAEAMLAAGSSLHLIATSREAFGITGEQIYPVRSLSLPAGAELEAIEGSEAVRIFVDRSRLVDPGFVLDKFNAPIVAEICRRLDGIALAIELAAARVALLSLDEIRTRLDDRFRLLTGGGRAAPRHQTLQATLHWSYDHLAAPEQELFRRLSVFAGGCTLAAAAHVSGAEDEYAVLTWLTALHDKSMLTVDREALGGPRYRMLETVRQYAQDRLAESGEGDATRGRHLRYFVSINEETEPLYDGARRSEAIALRRAEQENLLAAHAWCEHDADGGSLGLRLAAAVSWRHWLSSGQLERGSDIGRAALAQGKDAAPLAKCRVLSGVATLIYYMGRYDESRALAEQALAIGRELGNLPEIAFASVLVSFHHKPDEAPPLIAARYEERRNIATKLGDRLLMARNLNNLAEWQRSQGHNAAAEAGYEESLAITRGEPKRPGLSITILSNYACLLLSQGKVARGAAHLREMFAIAAAHALRESDEHLLAVGAALAAMRDEPERAARLHGASLAKMREAGAKREKLDEAFLAPLLARARSALGPAAFDAAERAGAALRREATLDELRDWLARLPDDL
jgi:predicted ATPase/DNA-binding winged helix-turn-helix (wHTH) protein